MKTEIIKAEQSNRNIDWNKVILVKNDENSIILTNGKHEHFYFNGTVIYSKEPDNIGFYHTNWLKANFTKITEPITIKFTP